jgi:hypothetical protein
MLRPGAFKMPVILPRSCLATYRAVRPRDDHFLSVDDTEKIRYRRARLHLKTVPPRGEECLSSIGIRSAMNRRRQPG